MSRTNNRRRRRNSNQEEKNFAALQEIKALLAILVKDKVEKEVHGSKQQLKEKLEYFSQRATLTRKAAELAGEERYITEIDALMHRVESKAEILQEKYAKLKSQSEEVTLDMQRTIGKHTDISKELAMLPEDMETFFNQVDAALDDITCKFLQYVIERYRLALEKYVTESLDTVSQLRSLATQIKSGQRLVHAIDNFQEYLIRSHRELLADIAEAKHLAEKPELLETVIEEYSQIINKCIRVHEKIRDEHQPFADELHYLIETSARRKRLSAFAKIFILDLLLYLQWSLAAGMVLPQWNALLAFIITGLVIVAVNLVVISKLAAIYGKHPSLFKITQFSLLNHLFAFSISLVIFQSLIFLLYIVLLHYLYLFLYYLINFLTETNPFLSWITNVSAIITIVALFIGLLKKLNLLKYMKNFIHCTPTQ